MDCMMLVLAAIVFGRRGQRNTWSRHIHLHVAIEEFTPQRVQPSLIGLITVALALRTGTLP